MGAHSSSVVPLARLRGASLTAIAGLAFGLLLHAFAPSSASAHKPLFVEPGEELSVDDASVSYAGYGEFARAGEQVSVTGPLDAGDELVAELLLPAAQPERSDPPTAWPTLHVETPGARVLQVPQLDAPEPFNEPFTRTEYLTIARLERAATNAGTYTWTATATGPGRFVLVLGRAEEFGAGDVLRLPATIADVREWAQEREPRPGAQRGEPRVALDIRDRIQETIERIRALLA